MSSAEQVSYVWFRSEVMVRVVLLCPGPSFNPRLQEPESNPTIQNGRPYCLCVGEREGGLEEKRDGGEEGKKEGRRMEGERRERGMAGWWVRWRER